MLTDGRYGNCQGSMVPACGQTFLANCAANKHADKMSQMPSTGAVVLAAILSAVLLTVDGNTQPVCPLDPYCTLATKLADNWKLPGGDSPTKIAQTTRVYGAETDTL